MAGSTIADVQDEYQRLAPRYEERWAGYMERTNARTLRHLRPAEGESILDVGCGTGVLLRAILGQAPREEDAGGEA